MNKIYLKLAVLVLMSVPFSSFATPILNVQGGILMSASGVDVGGTLYDVEFVDGSCVELFSGCDDSGDFAFTSEAVAVLAAQALLDQVFLDTVLGQFDSAPELTNGCQGFFVLSCEVVTPFGIVGLDSYNGIFTSNQSIFTDGAGGSGAVLSASFDTSIDSSSVLANWQLTATTIPEPSTLALTLFGLLAMRSVRRHAAHSFKVARRLKQASP